MRANLDAQDGYVLAEPAMHALAAHVGRHRAHELVQRAATAGRQSGIPLVEALRADPDIARHLPPSELAELARPERALGAAQRLVDDVVARG